MSNNELRRVILRTLGKNPGGSLKFGQLAGLTGADKRAVAKNLFFLEEKGFIEVRSVYNPGTLFPDIYYVMLNGTGARVAGDDSALELLFPEDNDHYMGNIDSAFDQLLRPMQQWADGNNAKADFMDRFEKMIRSEMFREFLEETYAKHRSK